MKRLLSNLQFEYELLAPKAQIPPPVREVSRRFRYILRLLPEHSEAQPFEGKLGSNEDLTPWGVTQSVTALVKEGHFPSVDIVKRVNHKGFSHKLERALKLELPFSKLLENEEELRGQIALCPHDWILKHPLGVSARNRCLGRAGVLLDPQAAWAQKRFRQGSQLLFEPWVAQRQDYSLHYHIARNGTLQYLGRCELLPEPGGMYCGNRYEPGNSKPESADRIVEHIAQEGYWGPVSLDCFNGELAGQKIHRPLVEINARHTFGRLCLELRRWVPEGYHFLWWHPGKVDRLPSTAIHPNAEPGWYRLPDIVDPERETKTLMAVGPDRIKLDSSLEIALKQKRILVES